MGLLICPAALFCKRQGLPAKGSKSQRNIDDLPGGGRDRRPFGRHVTKASVDLWHRSRRFAWIRRGTRRLAAYPAQGRASREPHIRGADNETHAARSYSSFGDRQKEVDECGVSPHYGGRCRRRRGWAWPSPAG